MACTVVRHGPGIYRVRLEGSWAFGQIKKDGKLWNAEIRESITGDLRRMAGVWTTQRDAVEECERLLGKPEFYGAKL